MELATDTQKAFDLVAPVAIYHAADVCFKEKARTALRKLKRQKVAPGHLKLDDAETAEWAREEYDRLFGEIVEQERPELEFGYDYWGAKGYKLPHQSSKDFEISGEACGHLPYFETAELLVERLND
jgi:hypothetical protein